MSTAGEIDPRELIGVWRLDPIEEPGNYARFEVRLTRERIVTGGGTLGGGGVTTMQSPDPLVSIDAAGATFRYEDGVIVNWPQHAYRSAVYYPAGKEPTREEIPF